MEAVEIRNRPRVLLCVADCNQSLKRRCEITLQVVGHGLHRLGRDDRRDSAEPRGNFRGVLRNWKQFVECADATVVEMHAAQQAKLMQRIAQFFRNAEAHVLSASRTSPVLPAVIIVACPMAA